MFRIDKAQQRILEEAFYAQLNERCQPDSRTDRPLPMVVGVETEYLVVDDAGRLVPETQRNDILSALAHSSPELGVSTLETHTYPVPIVGPEHNLIQELRRVEIETIRAAENAGCKLARIGTYPGPFSDFAITQQPDRYQRLMDISHELHGVYDADATDIQVGNLTLPRQRCDVMSGCQSVHLNIQLPAGELAVHLLNKTMELVPYLVALGAHSPLMNCQPAGYQEFRVPLWAPLFTFPNVDARYGVDTQRTGLPRRYYTDWQDYWQDVGNKLFLSYDIHKAFETNMKQFWRIARLKPCPGQRHDCLLEVRALSTQPTVEEDAAFYLLLTGLLHDPDWYSRSLLPMELVQANLEEASKHGLGARLYVINREGAITQQPAADIATSLIEDALSIWGDASREACELIAMLRTRLPPAEAWPAQESMRLYEQELAAGRTREEAARRVLMAYVVA